MCNPDSPENPEFEFVLGPPLRRGFRHFDPPLDLGKTVEDDKTYELSFATTPQLDALKERVATLERDINHNHDCYKHGCYRTLDKPTPSLAERTYEAVYWCQTNNMTIEFLKANVRIAQNYISTQHCSGEYGNTFLEAVNAMRQKMAEHVIPPILSFEDAKVGQRVQFYDHEKKVWRDALVLIITHAYFDIDTVTLRPNDGTDFTMSHQSWYEVGVRVRPTLPKETP